MPVVRRSSLGSASRRSARMPQCASLTSVPKSRLRRPVRTGLPTWRCSQGIAPGWMPCIRSPDDQVASVVQGLHETGELSGVVGHVSVEHHDVAALRRREAGEVGPPVAAPGLGHDPGARRRRQLPAAVGRAVVDHDHLALVVLVIEDVADHPDAGLDGLGLVQAGDDNRYLRGPSPGVRRPPRDLWCRSRAHRVPRRASIGPPAAAAGSVRVIEACFEASNGRSRWNQPRRRRWPPRRSRRGAGSFRDRATSRWSRRFSPGRGRGS